MHLMMPEAAPLAPKRRYCTMPMNSYQVCQGAPEEFCQTAGFHQLGIGQGLSILPYLVAHQISDLCPARLIHSKFHSNMASLKHARSGRQAHVEVVGCCMPRPLDI